MPNHCDLIILAGDIDVTHVGELQAAVDAFQRSDAVHVAVDLSEATSFGSAAARCVAELCAIAIRRDGTVTLINPSETDIRVIDLCGLRDLVLQERHYSSGLVARLPIGVPTPRLPNEGTTSPIDSLSRLGGRPGLICLTRVGRAYARVGR